jgi:hypothetical protein
MTALLNRPLHLPAVKPGTDCPVTRARPLTAGEGAYTTNVFSTGPLYPLPAYLGPDTTLRLTGKTPGPDGLYENKVVWVSKGGYTGPAIVRVAQLDGPARGQVKLYYEPTASHGDTAIFNLTNDPTSWPSGTFVPRPGCFAYQIDGTTFTDAIIFKVTP